MERPTKRTSYDWTVEILSFFALIWACVPLLSYESLPADVQIPIHYNLLGLVDGWGDRSDLLSLLLITVLGYIVLSALEWCYKIYNFPIKVTESNANELHRLGVCLVRHTKLILMLMLAYTSNLSLAIAMGKGILYECIMPVLITVLFMTLIIFVVKMLRIRTR